MPSNWSKLALADLMRQGFMKPQGPSRARREGAPRLVPASHFQGKKPTGAGLLYDVYHGSRQGKVGRALGRPINFYAVEDGEIVTEGHKTAAQAAKAFAKARSSVALPPGTTSR
jgi:hypothetical protein